MSTNMVQQLHGKHFQNVCITVKTFIKPVNVRRKLLSTS